MEARPSQGTHRHWRPQGEVLAPEHTAAPTDSLPPATLNPCGFLSTRPPFSVSAQGLLQSRRGVASLDPLASALRPQSTLPAPHGTHFNPPQLPVTRRQLRLGHPWGQAPPPCPPHSADCSVPGLAKSAFLFSLSEPSVSRRAGARLFILPTA